MRLARLSFKRSYVVQRVAAREFYGFTGISKQVYNPATLGPTYLPAAFYQRSKAVRCPDLLPKHSGRKENSYEGHSRDAGDCNGAELATPVVEKRETLLTLKVSAQVS